MKKYRLVNIKTKEEHLCDKVTINVFDYYVSNDKIIDDGTICYFQGLKIIDVVRPTPIFDDEGYVEYEYIDRDFKLAVIATNNPNSNIPKVVNEVEILADTLFELHSKNIMSPQFETRKMFISGYNKCKETHLFNEEDMIEFAKWLDVNIQQREYYPMFSMNYKELLQAWNSQRPKTIYYE